MLGDLTIITPAVTRRVKTIFLPLFLIVLASLIVIPSLRLPSASGSTPQPWSFRDDFNYTSISQLQAAGWTTESNVPASYYEVGNSTLTLLNDGTVGAGAGYSNVPSGVSNWSVSTRMDWIGSYGGVSGYVGSLQIAVQTTGHSYDWMADGYYGHFALGMDGHNAKTLSTYTKQVNVYHTLQLDMINGTLYGYFDGSLVGYYTISDTTPGNTNLVNVQALASWETNNNFDWVQANNSPSPPKISPFFTINSNLSSISLLAGQSGNSTIQIGSQAGFAGTVSLTSSSTPAGLTTQLTPASVTLSNGGTAASTLTVVAPNSVNSATTYAATVTGTSGNVSGSVTLTVTVNSASSDFSITDSATSLVIPVGSERQTTVNVTSINAFKGNVTLVATPSSGAFSCWFTTLTNTAVVSIPPSVPPYPDPSYAPPSNSSLQFPTCGAGRPAGTYTLKITGTSGSLSHSVVLSVTITDFTLAGPSSISLNAGSSKTESITLSSLFGFNGTVYLSVASPSAVLASCPASTTLTGGGTATTNCSVYSPTAGVYNVTVAGTFTCGDCYYNGKDTNSVTTTVTVIGPSVSDFYLSSNPSTLTVSPGSSTNVSLTVLSFNSFSGTVSLSGSAPIGLAATFNPNPVTLSAGGNATSVLTISASSSVLLGTYNVNVTGTSGSRVHTITVTVNVVVLDFTISETPTSQAIPLGSEQQTVLELDSVNGFSGNVNLVATPSSAAIACWFTYTLTSTATLYVPPNGSAYQYPTCGAYGAAGSYKVTFTGTSGSHSHSVVLPVTLMDYSISASSVSFTAPASGNGTVTLSSLSGLSGPVNLSVSAPSAVTASCPSSVNLAPGATTTVSCSYSSGIPGTYNVTITGDFVCSGCYYDGNDSHSVTIPIKVSQPSQPDFYTTANPNGLMISPGSSTTSTISLTSLGGFTGTVNLAASISPSGPTLSLSPASLALSSGGSATSTLKVSTSSTTPTGSYTITITVSSGSLIHTVKVSLSLTSSGFTISESPTSQLIPLGSEMQTVLEVDSVNGFSGNVNLVATPSSPAVACWFTYTLTSQATVFVPANGYANQWPTCGAYGPAGSYTVTFTGTSGSINYSIVLPVTVMDFSMSASAVSFTAGSSGTSTLSLSSLSGLAGSVNISVATPPGVAGSCPSNVVLPSSGTVTTSCTFSSNLPGNYTATITGKFVCSGCYYDGTDSRSASASVTVTSTDPPVSGTFNFHGITVTASGSLTVTSGKVSGTVSVTATNSSSGTVLFSKTYTISSLSVSNSQARFLLNVAVSPNPLSADVTIKQINGVWSATVMVTRQLDVARQGTVNIVDISMVNLEYGSIIGSPRYNPNADVTGDGTIDMVDISIVSLFYGATVYA